MNLTAPQHSKSNLFVPFITTTAVFDIKLVLLLFPIWWLIGIEQLIWPISFTLISIKTILLQKYTVKVTATIKWLFLFLIVHLISGFFIVETYRWVTFIRNFSTYIALFCLLLILINQIKKWEQIESILKIYVVLMILTAAVGFLGILEIWQPNFTSVIGNFLPEWIKSTSYGQRIATRSVGNRSWFIILRNYFRVTSFFLYATLYASALSFAIPPTLYLLHTNAKKWMKLFYGAGILLMAINMIYTTGRIAIIGCVAGGLYFLFFYSKWRSVTKLFVAVLVVSLTVYILSSNSISAFVTLYEEFVFARGSGSFQGRSLVYQITLEQFLQRPIFGWGTERDVVGSAYPAGSHSYYLGVLYKQGLVGFLTFLGMLFAIWRESAPLFIKSIGQKAKEAGRLLLYGRWVFVAFVINSFTDVLELDATTLIFFGLIIGLLIKTRILLKEGQIA